MDRDQLARRHTAAITRWWVTMRDTGKVHPELLDNLAEIADEHARQAVDESWSCPRPDAPESAEAAPAEAPASEPVTEVPTEPPAVEPPPEAEDLAGTSTARRTTARRAGAGK